MPPGVSAVTNQIPFSEQTLRELSQAFRRDARRENLSETKAERFEAWALAFASWCADQELDTCDTDEVSTCRIGAFQVALRGHPETTRREAIEAMDALGFFFGAAEETKSALCSAGLAVENREESSSETAVEAERTDESSDDRPGGVFPGWPDEKTDGETDTGEGTAGRHPVPRPTSHEDASSTAKAFVRAFHSRLDSMHDAPSDESEEVKGKMQSARAQ